MNECEVGKRGKGEGRAGRGDKDGNRRGEGWGHTVVKHIRPRQLQQRLLLDLCTTDKKEERKQLINLWYK